MKTCRLAHAKCWHAELFTQCFTVTVVCMFSCIVLIVIIVLTLSLSVKRVDVWAQGAKHLFMVAENWLRSTGAMTTQEDFEKLQQTVEKMRLAMDAMASQHAATEKAMKLEVEALKCEKTELGVQIERIQKELNQKEDTNQGGVLRGYDHKTAPKPNPYDFGDEHDFFLLGKI